MGKIGNHWISSGILTLKWSLLSALLVLQVTAGQKSPASDNSTTTSPATTSIALEQTTPSADTDKTVDLKMKCLIIDHKMMNCDCFGLNFENETLLKSLNLTDNHYLLDRFLADKQRIHYLSLKNCTLTEKTSTLTNSMYHLINFDFEDCNNVSTYLYPIMKRRFERDSTANQDPTKVDDLASTLRIHYTTSNADPSWPSTFALVPASECVGAGEPDFVKNFNLQTLELLNVPNFQDFDLCTFLKFPYVMHLDISYSNMGVQFPNISRWHRLKYLRCRSCEMKRIPKADLLPQFIEVIDFSNNKIIDTNPCYAAQNGKSEHDSNCYLNQKKLGHLDLSLNQLKFVHFDLFKYTHLEVSESYDPFGGTVYIDFNNNQFQWFPFQFFTELSQRKDDGTSAIINAEHNPFYCNCEMLYVKEAVQAVGNAKIWANCHLPTFLEDKSIMSLSRSHIASFSSCRDLDFSTEEPHKSGWAVFFEVCIAFIIIGIVALIGYYAYTKFKNNRGGGYSSTYNHVRMHPDPTTVPYSTENEEVFTIDDPQNSPLGPSPVLAVQ